MWCRVSKMISIGWVYLRQSWCVTMIQAPLMWQTLWSNDVNPQVWLWLHHQRARKGAWSMENERNWQFRSSFGHFEKPSQWNARQKLDLIMYCCDGRMVRHCGVHGLSTISKWREPGERLISFHPGQAQHWRNCAIWRSVLGAKPFRGWSQIEHEVDARSFCRQAWPHRWSHAVDAKSRHNVDRTPTHNTHLCNTVCSQARNASHALGSRIAVSSLCAWKESVIWSAHVSPVVALSPTVYHEHIIFLIQHFFLLRHQNAHYNRDNTIISKNTQYIMLISMLSQPTSSAIKNHSGVKTCRGGNPRNTTPTHEDETSWRW